MSIRTSVGALCAAAALSAPAALAQTRSQVYGDALTQQAQTVFVEGDAGMTTYESEAAGSKETQSSSAVKMGGWAGEGRVVGASITAEDSTVDFSLNESQLHTSFRDVEMKARLWWFVPSAGVSLSEVDVKSAGEETVGLYGTGANAGLALQIPLHEGFVAEASGKTVVSNKVYDKLGQDAKLGRRDEADAHMSFDVTDRLLDLIVGYKVREYSVEVGDTSFKEKSQGAYAGLRLGFYF